jgi:hypothetical protein
MKIFLYLALVLLFTSCATKAEDIKKTQPETKTSFQSLWTQLKSDELQELPHNTISYFKLTNDGQDTISQNAKRTLTNHADILKPFDKLAHPNGICLKGVWQIENPTRYSGFFEQGSKSLIVVRISTALENTTNDATRAFGFAGKLFGTMDETKVLIHPTANFFLIDDLGGTNAKYFKDTTLTNAPSVTFTYEVFKNLFYALKVSSSFKDADKNPTIRQLYEISELGENNKSSIVTPKYLKIALSPKSDTLEAKDFRDELKIEKGKKLIFDIFTSSSTDENKNWQKIGKITLNQSVVSNSCDHRLHFHHPHFKDNLEY